MKEKRYNKVCLHELKEAPHANMLAGDGFEYHCPSAYKALSFL